MQAKINDAPIVATQNAYATLSLATSFSVVGGTVGDLVPLDISTVLSSSANYPNYASAEIYTDGSGSSSAFEHASSSFNGTLHLLSTSGSARQVTILNYCGRGLLHGWIGYRIG